MGRHEGRTSGSCDDWVDLRVGGGGMTPYNDTTKAGDDIKLHRSTWNPPTVGLKLRTCGHQSNAGFVFLLAFFPDSRVCVWVCVCPTCMAVSPAASLSDRNASPHAGGGDRRRQRLRAVASTVTAAHTNGSRRLLWPFPYTGFDTFPPSARFVSRQTVSTCYCCPPAWLRICRSVCQPASGLRREASFIKRKQAGDQDMRTVNLLEMFQRLRGSSHWKPARNILHQHWINLHSTNKLEKADNYI